MARAEMKPPRRTRVSVAVLVATLHVAAVLGLMHAFAPQIGEAVVNAALGAVDVTVTTPLPPPQPPPVAPTSKQEASDEGAAAPAGKKARPREISAPVPKIVLSPQPAPAVTATGNADSSGARDAGQGTGASGVGIGTGSGASGIGTGAGGGGSAKAVKLSGDIVSARDYPKATRALRLGSSVTIALIVGTDGRASDCRVVKASRDAEADRITCRLAMDRFRFRPARDASGRPVPSTYGWQQRWFTPATD